MSAAADRFADERAAEADPERRAVLDAAVRLLRGEPLRVLPGARRDTVKALAAEAGIDRFHLASAERGRHYALARRYLEAAQDPDHAPPGEQRLRDDNAALKQRAGSLKERLDAAERTVELLARANRVLTAENALLRADAAKRGGPALRAVPDRTRP